MILVSRRGLLGFGLISLMAGTTRTANAQAATPAWRVALVEAARRQVGVTTIYDAAYVRLAFPGGDVPQDRGVCTDVVVRAYRTAFQLDLQRLVNQDMKANFAAYPRKWGMVRPDPNIDHRRVPNLMVFFQRKGASLLVSENAADYKPGDLVSQVLPGNLPHIGFVSSRRSEIVPDRPLMIHNIGQGAREEDTLFAFPQTGHFRFAPA